MAVTLVLGMTESGKSYYVEKNIFQTKEKAIVFDNAHCFTGTHLSTLDYTSAVKIFETVKSGPFKLVYRPSRYEDPIKSFDNVISLASALGRSIGERVDPEKRLTMICDEADFVCSATVQSAKLKYLVNKGRHDNVDSVFIARDPHKIHTDIRRNASKVVTFFNPLATSTPFFFENFGKELCQKIAKLPKYHYLMWDDTFKVTIHDQRGKTYFTKGR